MKTLFLLGTYLPNPFANGICADAIIKEMQFKGDSVWCIANRHPGYRKTQEIDGVIISRIGIQKHQFYSIKAKECNNPFLKRLYRFISLFFDVFRLLFGIITFPVMSPRRSRAYYYESKKIIEKEGIERVIAVNLPIEPLDAVFKIKKEFPSIQTIAYLLDPISGGIHNKFISESRASFLCETYERRILASFDVVVVQKEHERHFRDTFSPAFLSSFHFLGVPLLKDKTFLVNQKNKDKKAFILYAGGISLKNRNPRFIIEVFKHVKKAKLVMYLTNDVEEVKELAGDCESIEINPAIPYEQLNSQMCLADCFLNIGNNQKMQSPSKIIEYLCYGKPIISTYRIDGDTSLEYFKKYSLSLCLDERKTSFVEGAMMIDAFLEKVHGDVADYCQIKRAFSDYTSEAFLNAISPTNEVIK